MTRTSGSIGSSTVNSKSVWLSKLLCRRDEMLDVNEIEKHIVSLNGSVELAFPVSENRKEVENKIRTLYNRRKYSHVPSLPMCLIGCNRNDDETVCSNSDPKINFSNDWMFHSDQETESNHENDQSHDSNSKRADHQFDKTQICTVNREVLSPTLQLLHEVYMKKLPSTTGVYFLPSKRHHASQNDFHSNLKEKETNAEDKNAVDDENNTCDAVQMERMVFRQQLRYDAIRKELFDSVTVTPSSFEKKSGMGNNAEDFRRQEYNETDSLIDTVGCHAISFWNYLPSVSNLLLKVLPESDALDDDSSDGVDISYTEGQSYFSYGTDTSTDSTEDKNDYNHIPYTVNKQESNFKKEDHENPAYFSSSMDQSLSYVMMKNSGSERAPVQKQRQKQGESNSSSGNTIDTKKISELTIGDFTVNSIIQTDFMENELNTRQHEDELCLKESKRPDFGWARHFQPFGNHQIDIDIRQNLWLNVIHESFKDQNTGSLLLDAVSDQQLQRRVAANDALQRIVQQRTQHDSFNHLSTIVFDLWR